MKTVGVLGLQGDFEAHRKAVERAAGALGQAVRVTTVRTAADLDKCDGLIIPGGESTTMLKLLELEGLTQPILQFAASRPVYGSCAGAILLAKQVTHPSQSSLALVDIEVERNAYGRQIDSHISRVPSVEGEMEAVFIRAPIIRRAGPEVTILASYQGNPVWVEEGRHMVTTFHPELSSDALVHKRFLAKV